jgi:hypothetical protein
VEALGKRGSLMSLLLVELFLRAHICWESAWAMKSFQCVFLACWMAEKYALRAALYSKGGDIPFL